MARKVGVDVDVNLGCIVLKEGNTFVSHIPALDLITQGDTYEEAIKNAAEIAEIFFEETARMGTLDKVLTEMGWKKEPLKHCWIPPHIVGHSTLPAHVPAPA